MRDDRVDAGLNTGSVMFKILFAIFVPGPTTSGIEVITKLDVEHQAPQYWPLCLRSLLGSAETPTMPFKRALAFGQMCDWI